MLGMTITIIVLAAACIIALAIVREWLFRRMDRARERREHLRKYRADIRYWHHTDYWLTMQHLRDAGKVCWNEPMPLDPGLPWGFRRRYGPDIPRHISNDPWRDPKFTELLQRGDEAHVNYLFSQYMALKHLACKDDADFKLALQGIRTQDRMLQAVIKELELICQAPAPEAPAAPAV